MKAPLTIRDHLHRALAACPNRVAFVGEPDQPTPSMGEVTLSRLGEFQGVVVGSVSALPALAIK